MRLFILFILLLPLIFLETTFSTLPLTFIFVFSVAFVSLSYYRFIFAFLGGFFFGLFFTADTSFLSLFFVTSTALVGTYRSYFPSKLVHGIALFLVFEILFFLFTGLTPTPLMVVFGLILFFPVFYLVKIFLGGKEEVQLKFDFLRS